MKRISVLPDEVSQKIAAGEVVERPLSVVKELVENALDAGASEIKVELEDGGRRLIRVTDNGWGMSRADAEICFERHATSKISSDADLEAIATLGFRGEALPSISAVSRIELKTSEGKGAGISIRREGDMVLEIADTAFPKGTSVEVRDIFFNLPARRKFLRTARSELTMAVRNMTHTALAHPEVRFILHHGSRVIFNFPAVKTLKERIFQIYGGTCVDNLMTVEGEEDGWTLSGYASRPPAGRGDRTRQLFFINLRPVKEKSFQAAFNQAYRGFMEKDRHPEGFLFLSIPFSEVDVNVHPAKTEVRFRDPRPLFRLVLRGVQTAILKEKGLKEIPLLKEKEETEPYRIRERPGKDFTGGGAVPGQKEEFARAGQDHDLFSSEGEGATAGPHARVLGQYRGTYIVAEDEDGIMIIDQHNAHERILYDQYLAAADKKDWPRKMGLLPALMEMSPSQALILEDHKEALEEMGFRVEAMGGRSFALKEFPEFLKEMQAREVLFTILEEIGEKKVKALRDRILAAMACSTAVKAGEPLSLDKMNYLVEKLFQSENPSLCPHGRPVIIRIGQGEIEKGLGRK